MLVACKPFAKHPEEPEQQCSPIPEFAAVTMQTSPEAMLVQVLYKVLNQRSAVSVGSLCQPELKDVLLYQDDHTLVLL